MIQIIFNQEIKSLDFLNLTISYLDYIRTILIGTVNGMRRPVRPINPARPTMEIQRGDSSHPLPVPVRPHLPALKVRDQQRLAIRHIHL